MEKTSPPPQNAHIALTTHRSPCKALLNPKPAKSPSSSRGFTLIEILVAVSILAFMTTILAAISGQASNLWIRNESQSQIRERARTVLDFIANDLRQVTLPLSLNPDHPDLHSSAQLLITPPVLDESENGTSYNSPDSIFWFAPIATSQVRGDLATIGYFIRTDLQGKRSLCRYFVNPDNPNYKLDEEPEQWVTPSLLDEVAPGDAEHDYRGLVFENVLGLWITAYDDKNQVITTRVDTRTDGKLPARIEISLVFIDDKSSEKIGDSVSLPSVGGSAEGFLESLPPALRTVAGIATTSVSFKDRR